MSATIPQYYCIRRVLMYVGTRNWLDHTLAHSAVPLKGTRELGEGSITEIERSPPEEVTNLTWRRMTAADLGL